MITLAHLVGLSFVLFTIGVVGVLVRRNLLTVLMSIELMLNAVNINLVAFGTQHNISGQVFALFVIAVAAAEVAVGLALAYAIHRGRSTVSVDEIDWLKW